MDEFSRLLDLAKKNYVQWGGTLEEDRLRMREERDSQR